MNRKANTLMIAALTLFAASPAFAGHRHGHHHGHAHDDGYRVEKVQKRLKRQRVRIEHGIDNGSLTYKEERKLLKQQRRIRRLTREFRDDGYLTRKEQRILIGKLDRTSDRIRRFKYNEANRYCRLDNRDHRHYGQHRKPAYTWNEADRMAAVWMLEQGTDR